MPIKFHPERFLTTHKDVDLRRKHFELIPLIGGGRKMRPGATLALRVLCIPIIRELSA